MGLPVLRTLSLCTCRRHYPGAASERIVSLISSRRSILPRKGCRVDLRIVLFEDCSAFTRVAACTLALSPICDTLERFPERLYLTFPKPCEHDSRCLLRGAQHESLSRIPTICVSD